MRHRRLKGLGVSQQMQHTYIHRNNTFHESNVSRKCAEKNQAITHKLNAYVAGKQI